MASSADAAEVQGSMFTSQEGGTRRRHFVIWPLVIAGLIAMFKYCSAEKVINPETGRATRVALSSEQEEQLGLQSYREVLSESEVIQSGPEREMSFAWPSGWHGSRVRPRRISNGT
jgi:hypothetical protein